MVQASSYSESTSTLQFGSRVSEITLGAAKRNVESGMMLDAREASAKLQRETAAARAEAAAAQDALEQERAEADQLRSANELMQQELNRLRVCTAPALIFICERSQYDLQFLMCRSNRYLVNRSVSCFSS